MLDTQSLQPRRCVGRLTADAGDDQLDLRGRRLAGCQGRLGPPEQSEDLDAARNVLGALDSHDESIDVLGKVSGRVDCGRAVHAARRLQGLVVDEMELAGPRVVGSAIETGCRYTVAGRAGWTLEENPSLRLRVELESHSLFAGVSACVAGVHRLSRDPDCRPPRKRWRGLATGYCGSRGIGFLLGRRLRTEAWRGSPEALLNHMDQLMGKHAMPLLGVQRRHGSSDDDVVSDGEGMRAQTVGKLLGGPIGVDPHPTEVVA